jgi:hypothetical protein
MRMHEGVDDPVGASLNRLSRAMYGRKNSFAHSLGLRVMQASAILCSPQAAEKDAGRRGIGNSSSHTDGGSTEEGQVQASHLEWRHTRSNPS